MKDLRHLSLADEVEHHRQQFRCLADWIVEVNEEDDHTGQSHIMAKNKTLCVFGWGNGKRDVRYALHEVLHAVMKTAVDRESEEIVIQDLCELIYEGYEHEA